MPKCSVNGAELFYQQAGSGSDVVLIHGLATNRAFWYLKIVSALKKRQHVTLYDLRGHGYSDMPPSGYTMDDMASDLDGLLDHLEIKRAVLIGHSFGGAVALHYASLHPERVRGLVIADSRIHSLQPTQRLTDSSAPLGTIEKALLAEADVDWEAEEHIGLRLLEEQARSNGNDEPADDDESESTADNKEFKPFGGRRGSGKLAKQWIKLLDTTTARNDFRTQKGVTEEMLQDLRTPVMAIYGEKSRCLESCTGLERLLPLCKAVMVPDTGHFHPIVKPIFFIKATLMFLNKLEGRSDIGAEDIDSDLLEAAENDEERPAKRANDMRGRRRLRQKNRVAGEVIEEGNL